MPLNIILSLSPASLSQAPEQDEVLQSIDRAIEGIHNVALKNGGKYNLEQRDVLQWVKLFMEMVQLSVSLCAVFESLPSSVAESSSITERRPSLGEVRPPPVTNRAFHLPAVRYRSVKPLLHPMALAETINDREACRYQEAWTVCKDNRVFIR